MILALGIIGEYVGRIYNEVRKRPRFVGPSGLQVSQERKGARMRVLITGGAGFLGSHLAEGFLNRGDDVTVMDLAPSLKVEHLLSILDSGMCAIR